MLPFQSPQPIESFQISDISIPRYGCLTVNEAIALDTLLRSDGVEELLRLSIETNSANRTVRAALTTILLLYRHSPTWTLEEVLLLSDAELEAASDFLLNERCRWKEPEPPQDDEAPRAKPIDWADLYWRIQQLYPHDRRFSADEFGRCPLLLIEEALEAANQRELEQASIAATPIALLGVHLLAAQGATDPRVEWINPFQGILAEQGAKEAIDPAVARSFLQLSSEGAVPGWVLEIADVEQLRLAAK